MDGRTSADEAVRRTSTQADRQTGPTRRGRGPVRTDGRTSGRADGESGGRADGRTSEWAWV